ncbi:Aste57867_16107 [Aphanomyces stellatus]|uniref:Aste57867_16107 protein n=1 Tax=Aphanomyces stellatus TaxID=120398 RepID=A0A485L4P9_9STRA|nr:hypothetical protein As57867_016051 [Aphanomyces stellatus]VFT92890.1 Aste57867_16107 [Aphanomyces stellatus]
MPKTAFVTGATGFLGQHIVDVLLKDGEWTVIAFVRASSNTIALASRVGVQCVVGNLRDSASIAAVMPEGVDAVIHAAANLTLYAPQHAEQWEDNVTATKAMCDAALAKHAKRFVFVSSTASFGNAPGVITEDSEQLGNVSPVNYAQTKYAAEQCVRAAIRDGLQAIIVNPAHIIGPYDKVSWSRLFIMLSQGKLDGIPPGAGSFAYGPCVAEAIVVAASGERGRVGHNYFLGGANASFHTLLISAADLIGVKETRKPLPAWLLLTLGWFYDWYAYLVTGTEPKLTYEGALLVTGEKYCDSTKAKTELGYKTMTIEEMLPPILAWLKTNKYL